MSQIFTTEAQVQAIVNSIVSGQRNSAGGLAPLDGTGKIPPQFVPPTGDYQGPAAPSDNPGTPTDPVYYIAGPSGTYTNFGGLTVTASDGLNILSFVPGSGWSKSVVPINLDEYAIKDDFTPVEFFVDIIRVPSKNLFNKLETKAGFINSSGNFTPSLNTLSSNFIPVKLGVQYIFSPNATLGTPVRFAFFTSSKTFYSSVNSVTGSSHVVTSPIDGFVIINIGSVNGIGSGDLTDNSLVNVAQYEEGTIVTPYQSFKPFVDGERVVGIQTTLKIPLIFDIVGNGSVYRSDNGKITDITGAGFPNASRSFSLVPVEPNKTYIYSGSVGGSAGVAGYDINQLFNARILDASGLSLFGSIGVNNHTDIEITIPNNVFFVGLSTRDQVNHPISFSEKKEDKIENILNFILLNAQSSIKVPDIKIIGINSNEFIVRSICENGEYLNHTFERLVKTSPQLEDGWLCSVTKLGSELLLQGNFNWIHQLSRAGEGAFVGIGHGCEVFIDTRWFLDGEPFDPASIVGQTIEGSIFSFQWTSEIYAVDASLTTNGAEAVAKVPLEKSTRHHMYGEIKGFNEIYLRNKLIFLRDNTAFTACYPVMLAGYSPYFKYIQVENIENSINIATPASQTAVSPSTAIINGQTYNTSDGKRGELAFVAHMWSDDYPYKVTQIMKPLVNVNINKFSIQSASGPNGVSSRNKLYFQPVVTSVIAAARGISADVFNTNDFIEVEGYRKITI